MKLNDIIDEIILLDGAADLMELILGTSKFSTRELQPGNFPIKDVVLCKRALRQLDYLSKFGQLESITTSDGEFHLSQPRQLQLWKDGGCPGVSKSDALRLLAALSAGS